MTVPVDFNTRTEAVGNGVSTTFPYDFLCLDAQDMRVSVNGNLAQQSGYTIAGLGSQQGGDVVFNSPPDAGASILMELSVIPERQIDYQNNGDLHAETLNLDFDRLWLAIRTAYGQFRRALLLGEYDIDGQGAYRARGNRITGLANPISLTDAVNNQTLLERLAEIAQDGTGQAVLNFLRTELGAANIGAANSQRFALPGTAQGILDMLTGQVEPTTGIRLNDAIPEVRVYAAPVDYPWQHGYYLRLAPELAISPGEVTIKPGPRPGLKWVTNFNPAAFDVVSSHPSRVDLYVSLSAGNNGNDGLSTATPVRSIFVAIQKALAAGYTHVFLNIEPGYYGDLDSFLASSGGAITFNCTIKPWVTGPGGEGDGSGRIKSSSETVNASFALDSATGLYKGTYSSTVDILDSGAVGPFGGWLKYERVPTIAECQARPGTWHQEAATGNSVFVHPLSGPFVPGQHRVMRQKQNFRMDAGNYTVYAENVDFYGSSSGGAVRVNGDLVHTNTLMLVNCGMHYAGVNGLASVGGSFIFCWKCTSLYATYDGFNHHAATDGTITRALEIACLAVGAGSKYLGVSNMNAFTSHDGCIVTRWLCEGANCQGPLFADVSDAQAWIEFPVAYASRTLNAPGHTGNSNLYISGPAARMWINGAISRKSDWDIVAASGAKAFVRDYDGWIRFYTPKNITPY